MKEEETQNQNKDTNWIEEMILREALPESVRKETTKAFLKKWKVKHSTYYYQASKKENQERILKISLQNARKHAPEVLENLGHRAKENSRDAELYLEFILELSKKTQIDLEIPSSLIEMIKNYGASDKTTNN